MKLPRQERKRMEAEERRKEVMALREIEVKVWRKWRGKVDKQENKVIGKMTVEDLDTKIDKIQKRLEEIKIEEEKTKLRRQKKQKLEAH